jgi:two-component system, NarL family, invasion response regulator UvrY
LSTAIPARAPLSGCGSHVRGDRKTHSTMRILLIDDHAVVRQGLKLILADHFPRAVFGEARNAHEALTRIWKEKWDVVVLDITMPGRSGLEVLKEIKRARKELPVLILSMHPEDQFAVRILRAGAAGYLTKESAGEELVGAIRKVLAGGRYISQPLAERMASYLDVNLQKAPHEELSDREFQILRLIALGKSVGRIAKDLSLSVSTVSTYRARILRKMAMENNAEVTHYAVHQGLVR